MTRLGSAPCADREPSSARLHRPRRDPLVRAPASRCSRSPAARVAPRSARTAATGSARVAGSVDDGLVVGEPARVHGRARRVSAVQLGHAVVGVVELRGRAVPPADRSRERCHPPSYAAPFVRWLGDPHAVLTQVAGVRRDADLRGPRGAVPLTATASGGGATHDATHAPPPGYDCGGPGVIWGGT
jgi:hypothetical protein